MNRVNNTERLGVNKVESFFLDENWIPRTILQSDVGVDMEVEICESGNPTGQLFGIQIKTGEAYFKETGVDNVVYRGSLVHLKYWLNHSLPIVLMLHNPVTGETIWEKIVENKIIKTKIAWKIEVPRRQVLCKESYEEFRRLNKLPIYFQRLQRMAVDKKLIEKVSKGDVLIIEIEEWVNKTSGRASINLIEMDADGNEEILTKDNYFHFHGPKSLSQLFPWADFEIEDDYYYEQEYDDFMNTYGIWDWEEREYAGSTIDWKEYRESMPKIRALGNPGDEVQTYRLWFNLNELGKAFLTLNNYLDFGNQLKLNIGGI